MATQYATIRRESKGALWIELRYPALRMESSGTRLEYGEEMFGVRSINGNNILDKRLICQNVREQVKE